MDVIVLRLFVLVLPAAAVLLSAFVGPWPATVACTLVGLIAHGNLRRRFLDRLLGETTPRSVSEWLDPIEVAVKTVDEKLERMAWLEQRELERGRRLRSLDSMLGGGHGCSGEENLLANICEFVRACGGEHGFVLFSLGAGGSEVFGEWVSSNEEGVHEVARTRWSRNGVGGALGRVLHTLRDQNRSAAGNALLSVNGELPRELPDLSGRILALASTNPPEACVEGERLHTTSCPSYQADPAASIRSAAETRSPGQNWKRCVTCTHYPVHGALLIFEPPETLESSGVDTLAVLARTVGALMENATLQRRGEQAEELRSQILDAMFNALLSTDQHGRIIYANAKARELVAPDDPVGRRLEELVDLPGGSGAVTRTLMEGRAYLAAQGLLRRAPRDDEPANLPIQVNLTPLRPEAGGVKGAVCVLADRSQVRAMQDEIRHLDTLAAIGRFASSLAHEIRNPLGGIQAGVEFLGRDKAITEETRANLNVIQGEVQRLDGILKDLLAVSRPREMVVSACDPIELATRAIEAFEDLARAVNVKLTLRAPKESDPLHGDRDMIYQVLVNLIKNAIEAAPSGGEVEVMVHAVDPADASRARARFEVADDGPGISSADLPHLFEPFYSRKSEGTGLGLYVCHGYVERHGGRLRVENRRGGGARFLLDLPRIPALLGGTHATPHSRG